MPDEEFELPPDLLGRIPLFAELAKVLSWSGGPVNWDLARQVAVAVAAGEQAVDEPSSADAAEMTEAVRLAELWLAESPGLPAPGRVAGVVTTTPAGWAERATSLRELVDPLAGKVLATMDEQAASLTGELRGAEPDAPGAVPDEALLSAALKQMAPLFLGIQSGVVVGTLALSVHGTYDLPYPAAEEGAVHVIAGAIDSFADAYRLDRREVRQWTALHQAAHRMAFEALPWVSTHFYALFHGYVAALSFDLSGAAERLGALDLANPQRLREAMEQEGFFGLLDTAATGPALARVQTLIGILESFVDLAVESAATRLPSAARISEAMARRRTNPGAGERMFRRFIGLELRPEQARAAEAFCRTVLASAGWPALMHVWDEVDNLPAEAELADPTAWLARIGR